MANNFNSLKLDQNGDLQITNNNVVTIEGNEAIHQHIIRRFQTHAGEWFLDINLGVPWIEEILIKGPSFVAVQSILKAVILNTIGVTELVKFDFGYDQPTRTTSLEFECRTEDGLINYNGLVEVLP